jgi:hypothetical protein
MRIAVNCLINDITGKSISFVPDQPLTADPTELSVKLANVPLDTLKEFFQFAKNGHVPRVIWSGKSGTP